MSGKNQLAKIDDPAGPQARQGPGAGAYIRPWLTTAVMVPAGWAAHLMWGDAGLATGLAAGAIAATGGVLTLYTHWLTRARTWYAHTIATASTAGTTAWMAAATVVGTGRPLLDIGLWLGGGLALFSNIHTWSKNQGSSEDEAAPTFNWNAAAAMVGLRGTTATVTSQTEQRTVATVRMSPGQTVDELTNKLKQLASAMGVGRSALRAVEDPEDAAQAEVTVLHQDVMRQLVAWPGLNPTQTATSLEDGPLELGVFEDGVPFTDTLNNRHSLTMGMAGSGKSVYAKCKMVQVADRNDTFVIAIDLAKGKQTLGPIEPAIGWGLLRTNASTSAKKEAREMLAALKRAVGARADYLGDQGLTQWTKDCGLTFLYVVIEEAAQLVDFDEIVDLAQIARSAGVHLNLSLQRASWGNVDTDARANLGDGVCFGVRDAADAAFALPDHVTDAGAAPEQWKKSRPGAAFAAVEAQDQERWTTPIKMYGPPASDPDRENEILTPAAHTVGDQDAKLDTITREAFGQPYADYLATHHDTSTPTVAPSPAPVPAAVAAAPQRAGPEQEEDMELEEEFQFSIPDPDPDLHADIDDAIEISPAANFQLPAKKGTKESAETVRARLETQLHHWAEQKTPSFSAAQLGKALNNARSRSWLYTELQRLRDQERLIHEDDGTWTIITGQLAAA